MARIRSRIVSSISSSSIASRLLAFEVRFGLVEIGQPPPGLLLAPGQNTAVLGDQRPEELDHPPQGCTFPERHHATNWVKRLSFTRRKSTDWVEASVPPPLWPWGSREM